VETLSSPAAWVHSIPGKLRTLMEKHLTALEAMGLMRDLNEAVQTELDGVHYATMVAVGFHGRRGLPVLSNAGHPPPFWHRTRRDEWGWFDEGSERHRPGVFGTPLGLLPDASYSRTIVKPEPGDLIVLYSDGVSEARDPSGEELGRDRLMEMARGWIPATRSDSERSSRKQYERSAAASCRRTMRRSSCWNDCQRAIDRSDFV
jgi:serine phosphatase RsbU (regulator of sigma subunit)